MAERVTAQVGSKQIIIETGKLAKQADGSVTVQLGETIVMVAAVAATRLAPRPLQAVIEIADCCAPIRADRIFAASVSRFCRSHQAQISQFCARPRMCPSISAACSIVPWISSSPKA